MKLIILSAVALRGLAVSAVDACVGLSTSRLQDCWHHKFEEDVRGTSLMQKRRPAQSKTTVAEDWPYLPIEKASAGTTVSASSKQEAIEISGKNLSHTMASSDDAHVGVHPRALKSGVMDLTASEQHDKAHVVLVKQKQKQSHKHLHLVQQALLGVPIFFTIGGSLAVCGYVVGQQKARAEMKAASREAGQTAIGAMVLSRPQSASLLQADDSEQSDAGSCSGLGFRAAGGIGLESKLSATQASNVEHLSPKSSPRILHVGDLPRRDAQSAHKALPRWKRSPQHALPVQASDGAPVKADHDCERSSQEEVSTSAVKDGHAASDVVLSDTASQPEGKSLEEDSLCEGREVHVGNRHHETDDANANDSAVSSSQGQGESIGLEDSASEHISPEVLDACASAQSVATPHEVCDGEMRPSSASALV